MVKEKNPAKELGILSYLRVLISFDIFDGKKVNLKQISLFIGILLVLSGVVAVVKSMSSASGDNPFAIFAYVFVGTPIMMFLLYSAFYVILNAFEDKRKDFFATYLVFFSICMPFVFIYHILDLLTFMFILENVVVVFLGLVKLFLAVYFLVMFVTNFRVYYGTNAYRIIVSFVLVDMLLIFMGMMTYMTFIVSQMTAV